jgi:acetolactate synthase-1/2/3 large subunit
LFFDKNYAFTPISSPNYEKLAQAYWINGYSVDNEDDFKKVLEKELNTKWPALIEVKVEQHEENIFPMVPAWYSLKDTIISREDLN